MFLPLQIYGTPASHQMQVLQLRNQYTILKQMDIQENVSLRDHSTMRLGGNARYLCDVTDRNQISQLVVWAKEHNVPHIMIGTGSNIIWRDEGFPGLVMVNKIMGFEVNELDENNSYLTVGAGENWDSVVARSVEMGYSGIEQLSLIPGTAGATPVQNVGAYGREIKDVLTTVEAYDTQENRLVTLRGDECGFAYRTSRFKSTDKHRFFITAITLHLTKTNPQPPFYTALQQYFEDHGITTYTPATVREAIIAIRSSKLPDPALVANNGSFFCNPIIKTRQFTQLRANYPAIPHWTLENGDIKLSAAWLVEQTGFKNYQDQTTGMATWPMQPLVLVNEHAAHTADLIAFRDQIVTAVKQKFDITLQQEPELI